jgi:nuclear pore complex protein Nup155
MAWEEDEAIGLDVASAGLHVSERIGRNSAGLPDLDEALEASRYTSHPYSSYPQEVSPARPALYSVSTGFALLRR